MSNNAFLPEDYSAPTSSTGNYTKLADGETRLRILSNPIIGFEYWNNDGKPVRVRTMPSGKPADMRLLDAQGKPEKIKEFWAMKAYNFTTGAMQVFQVTQAQIKTQLVELSKDADWGHPKNYDIKINRSGKGLETKYTVNPAPAKPVSEEVKAAFAATPINLDALFAGGDPFASTGSAPAPAAPAAAPIVKPAPAPVAQGVPEFDGDLPF